MQCNREIAFTNRYTLALENCAELQFTMNAILAFLSLVSIVTTFLQEV